MQSENNKIDEGLFAKIADGDNEAFAQLYLHRINNCMGFYYRLRETKKMQKICCKIHI